MRAGFEPITVHDQAVALSAALEREGLLDAPAGNQRVAELYHETVGVHVEALVAAKDMPGLVHTVGNLQKGKHEWTHGDLIVRTEDNARKFSAALKSKGLLEAPPGHWLVKALYCELFASDREKAIAKMKMPGLEVEVADLHKHRYTWRHGELFVTTETEARTFSAALQRRGLLEARAGDSRVQSTARKSKFHGHIFAEVRPSFLVSTGQESVRRGRHRATPCQKGAERFDSRPPMSSCNI